MPALAPRLARLPATSVLGSTVPVAVGLRARLLGLALLPRERAGEGLLIPRCRSVHTFGMRFEIEVVFVGDDGEMIERHPGVPRCRIVRCAAAAAVLERPVDSPGGA